MNTKLLNTQYEENELQDIEALDRKMDEIVSFAASEGVSLEKGSKFLSITEKEFEGELKQKNQNYGNQKIKLLLQDNYQDILIGVGYALVIIINLFFAFNLIKSAIYLDLQSLHFNEPITQIFNFTIVVLSGTLWFYSTTRIWWNFYNRKFLGLYIVLITFLLRATAVIFTIFYSIFIPILISKLKVTVLMTENLVTVCGWTVTIVPTLGLMIFATIKIYFAFRQPDFVKEIESFKLKYYIELKSYSKFDYDIVVVRDLRNGKKVIVRQHDRYIHGCTVGATGTAKTSSVLLNMINQDLNTKARNEDAQKKTIVHFIKKGWAYVEEDFDDSDYNPEFLYTKIKPVPGFEKRFQEEIVEKYKSAGLTVIAPDPSLTDNVYDLSIKKGFNKCNRIDPVKTQEGNWKPGIKGFDPLYISPRIPEWSRRKEIIKRATLCADIMQAMFEMSGKSDPYFASVNRIGTLVTSIVVMLAHERVYGEKPKLSHIRNIINNFDLMKNYVPELLLINKENNGVYTPIINIVNNEFLGLGRETFEKHAKGLRIQITNFLMNPDIEALLCSDNTIDMDAMLEKGEITVVNIELGDLGPVDSPAFGLFVTISMINAVLRRSIKGDEWSRLPHFWTIDEFPIIVNPKMEACFTLFRKFRTAMMVAMQTLDQMNKNPFLSYLKGVILNSCGLHIIFGRTNLDDQKTYSLLSGMVDKYVEQKGITETPISVDNPQYTTKTSFTTEQVARVEQGEMHDRDFQEVTLFRVHEGRPVPAMAGRVDFLKKWDWLELPRYKVDWIDIKNNQPYQASDVKNGNENTDDEKSLRQDLSMLHGEGTLYVNTENNKVPIELTINKLDNENSVAEEKVNTNGEVPNVQNRIFDRSFPEPKKKKWEQASFLVNTPGVHQPQNTVNSGKIPLGDMDELLNYSVSSENQVSAPGSKIAYDKTSLPFEGTPNNVAKGVISDKQIPLDKDPEEVSVKVGEEQRGISGNKIETGTGIKDSSNNDIDVVGYFDASKL